jgi:histidine triad (HIT) family protein
MREAAKETECPFCDKFGLGTNNGILYEGKGIIAVLSNPRLMPGHTLVIPKRHVSSLSELMKVEQDELFAVAIRFQERIKRIFSVLWVGKAGCDLSQHDRSFMPTTNLSVPEHLHIHLRPRYWRDGYYEVVLRHETALFQPLSSKEMEQYRKMLEE